MGTDKIIAVAAAFAMSLLPSSCSRSKSTSAQVGAPNANAHSASSNVRNLGDVALTNRMETCVHLSAGKSCTIVPTLLDRKNLQLVLTLETRNGAGKTTGLTVVQVVAPPDQSLNTTIGNTIITFTPKIAEE